MNKNYSTYLYNTPNNMYNYQNPYWNDNPNNYLNYYGQCVCLKNYGPESYVVNIEEATNQNYNFRLALWIGTYLQLYFGTFYKIELLLQKIKVYFLQ